MRKKKLYTRIGINIVNTNNFLSIFNKKTVIKIGNLNEKYKKYKKTDDIDGFSVDIYAEFDFHGD